MPIYKMKGSKDGLQKYRVRINYHDSTGQPRQIDRVTYGLDSAKELERQLNLEIRKEASARKMNLQELYDEYIKVKAHEVRESSLNKSKAVLQRHVLPELKSYSLSKLTLPVLQKWKLYIEQKDLATRTKKNIYGELRAMLNFAISMGYIITTHSQGSAILRTHPK